MTHTAETAVAPRNVAGAVVIKAGDVFLLSEKNGEVPLGNQDGFGLYYHDCRYLSGYQLRLAGAPLNALASTASQGSVAEFELTNEKLDLERGKSVAAQTFGIHLQRMIAGDQITSHDVLTIRNYDVRKHQFQLSVELESHFESIFEIRGLHPKRVGRENSPKWRNGALILSYRGADHVLRRLEAHFDPIPTNASGQSAQYDMELAAGEERQLRVILQILETKETSRVDQRTRSNPDEVGDRIARNSRDWLSCCAEVSSDSVQLNNIMERSLMDLGILKSSLDGHEFFSAGLPWYGALFGRDSIISALQTLAFAPHIAEQTIRLLAKYQGTRKDDWRDEGPGKILHELRRGELANLNEIPQTPYFGSVDSTPLFLILVGLHANWTGNLSLFKEIRQHVERALHWIDNGGAEPHGPYLSYASKSSKGLGNQGWKDSGDSIMNADGSLATPPIALVEVQGYVYLAKLLIADLYERTGDTDAAARLRQQAEHLKRDFNEDFWLTDKEFYAIALQEGRRPAAVISSNPGQALWTGIVDEGKAEAVVKHLTAEDMFSGWGIRTLSARERRYNPIGYHVGTVWPHDNSIIAAGLHRYGYEKKALQVLEGIMSAAQNFEHARLPEVFAGFSRKDFSIPVRYPVACHPQAWAAGSVPFMLSSLLGLAADAFNQKLRVIRPALPANVNELDLRRIAIGRSTVDLHFGRTRHGEVHVDVRHNSGSISIEEEYPYRRLERV